MSFLQMMKVIRIIFNLQLIANKILFAFQDVVEHLHHADNLLVVALLGDGDIFMCMEPHCLSIVGALGVESRTC